MKLHGLGSPIYDPDTGAYMGDTDDGSMSGGDNSTIYGDTGGTPPASTSGSGSWLDSIVDKLPQISAFMTAQQVQQINIKRAQRGLAPITGAQYGPNVAVGLDPGMQQLVKWGVMGGLGILALKAFTGGKRR